jgi:predicted transcriptional regulator
LKLDPETRAPEAYNSGMAILISPDLEAQVRKRASAAGLTTEAYVERLILEDEDWRELPEEPLDVTDEEFQEIHAAVQEGLAQAERGEGRPAKEVFADLRRRHGIPR